MASAEYECTKIGEYLYVGGSQVAVNWQILKDTGITRIINCSASVVECQFLDDPQMKYLVLNMVDGKQDDISWFMCEVINFIWSGQLLGEKTLLHCEKGISRSCSFAIAYGIWHAGCSFQQSFEFIKSRRPVCNPNAAFVCNLIEIDKLLNRDVKFQPLIFRCASHLVGYDNHTPVLKLCRDASTRSIIPPSTAVLDSYGVFVIRTPEIITPIHTEESNEQQLNTNTTTTINTNIESKDEDDNDEDDTNSENKNNIYNNDNIENEKPLKPNNNESVIYIWKGKNATEETAEIAKRLAGYMRGVISTAEKLIPINEGQEPDYFYQYVIKDGPYDCLKNPKLKYEDIFDITKLLNPTDDSTSPHYTPPDRTMRASRNADGSYVGDSRLHSPTSHIHSPFYHETNEPPSSRSKMLPYENGLPGSPKRELSRNNIFNSMTSTLLYSSRRNHNLTASTENTRIYSIHENNENGMRELSIRTSRTNSITGDREIGTSGRSSPLAGSRSELASDMSVSPTKGGQLAYYTTGQHSPVRMTSSSSSFTNRGGISNSSSNSNGNLLNSASANSLNLMIPTSHTAVPSINTLTGTNNNIGAFSSRVGAVYGQNSASNSASNSSLHSGSISLTTPRSPAHNTYTPSPVHQQNLSAPSPVSLSSYNSPGPPVMVSVPVTSGLRENFTLQLPVTAHNKRTFVEAGKSFIKKSIEVVRSPLRTSSNESAGTSSNSNRTHSPVGKKISLPLSLPLGNLNNNNQSQNQNLQQQQQQQILTGTKVVTNGTIVAPSQIEGDLGTGLHSMNINRTKGDSPDTTYSNGDVSYSNNINDTFNMEHLPITNANLTNQLSANLAHQNSHNNNNNNSGIIISPITSPKGPSFNFNSTRTDSSQPMSIASSNNGIPITSRDTFEMDVSAGMIGVEGGGTGRTLSAFTMYPPSIKSSSTSNMNHHFMLNGHNDLNMSRSKLHVPMAPLSMQIVSERKRKEDIKIPEDISLIRGPTPLDELIPVVTGELNTSRDDQSSIHGSPPPNSSPIIPPFYYSPRSGSGLNSGRSRNGSVVSQSSGSTSYRPPHISQSQQSGRINHSRQASQGFHSPQILTSRGVSNGTSSSTIQSQTAPTSPILQSFRRSAQALVSGTSGGGGVNISNSNMNVVDEASRAAAGGYIKPRLYQAISTDGVHYKWDSLGIYDETDLVDVSCNCCCTSCSCISIIVNDIIGFMYYVCNII